MSAVAETACRLQGDGSTPLQVLRLLISTSASSHDCMQVIAAIISGASLQGSVGAGELQTNMKKVPQYTGKNVLGGGFGLISKPRGKEGPGGASAICSSIEFSILKQPKHRDDM